MTNGQSKHDQTYSPAEMRCIVEGALEEVGGNKVESAVDMVCGAYEAEREATALADEWQWKAQENAKKGMALEKVAHTQHAALLRATEEMNAMKEALAAAEAGKAKYKKAYQQAHTAVRWHENKKRKAEAIDDWEEVDETADMPGANPFKHL